MMARYTARIISELGSTGHCCVSFGYGTVTEAVARERIYNAARHARVRVRTFVNHEDSCIEGVLIEEVAR